MSRVFAAVLAVMAAALITADVASAAKKAPRDFYGVIPQEQINGNDLTRLSEARVGTVRLGFNWAAFQQVEGKCEPEPQVGVCSWTVMDGIVGSLAQIGVRVLPTFSGSPRFLKKDPTRPPLKGRELTLWKAFVRSAAERYGHGGVYWQAYQDYGGKPMPIKDWQIWNEPNSKQFWSPAPNPRKYAKLVKASAKAIRDGDRKANIVLGGMFPQARTPIVPYMRGFHKTKRISRFYDEIGVHLYAPTMTALNRQMAAARQAARGGTRIRVTELGWSSQKSGHQLNKGKQGQAKMLRKSFKLLTRKRRKWHVTGLNWFALRDTNQDTCVFCKRSGLLKMNGKPKPAWREFKKFSK